MNPLARFAGGLTERVLGIVLALAAAQFPVYYVAYANTVAGMQLEAEARYRELEREAALLQLGVEEFIRRHETNADDAFRASGRMHRTTQDHYRRYAATTAALRGAAAWQKPLALTRHFDRRVHEATEFQPGLPLTLEAAAYALGGLLLAWTLAGLAGLALRPRRRAYA